MKASEGAEAFCFFLGKFEGLVSIFCFSKKDFVFFFVFEALVFFFVFFFCFLLILCVHVLTKWFLCFFLFYQNRYALMFA